MKKVILILSLLYSVAYAAEGQFISMQTQYFPNNLPRAVSLQSALSSPSDMIWDETQKSLLISEEGVYEFITIIQYGIKNTAKVSGSIYFWLEVDGNPLQETLQLASVPLQTETAIMRFDSSLPAKAGSHIRFMFSSTSPDIGLLSFAPTSSSPSIASVSLSVFKIGNIVTYY